MISVYFDATGKASGRLPDEPYRQMMNYAMILAGTSDEGQESSENLQLELTKLKSSPWWSIDSHYFIINTSNTSCDNAIDLLRCLFSALNSSLIIIIHHHIDTSPMYLDNNEKYQHQKNVKNHKCFDYTNSYAKSSVVTIPHKSKQITPEEKFKRYYSKNVVISTIISCILTLFAFGIYEKQGFRIAFFKVLRLIFKTGLLDMPTNTTMRIYFKHYHSNIDNIDDLKRSNHQVFVANEFKHYLNNFSRNYSIYLASDFCSCVLLNNLNATCVGRRDYEAATRYYLHMSKETVADFNETQLMRKNWLLKKKK
ncbi:hypothetical protein HCN44_011062 [Aphidius gifuensis]|uniref:Uncharacterized protein n=1 Tax=Aphidius gifuensis TaxID=684658 RepID=A0A834Y1C2_APHGI|nr:hypothetical protein HCN44_011062 [Aphidius gifuensis]